MGGKWRGGEVQYLAGYVIRKLILTAKKKNNEDEISILHNAITDDHNQKLIHSTNRGGLTSVKHEWVQILVLTEEMFRVETLSSARKIDVEKIKNTIQVHPKAISLFNSLVMETCIIWRVDYISWCTTGGINVKDVKL